jgi:pimeloyl-ACP methyl ester carboxylesterase
VLTNAEAYGNWPWRDERPFVRLMPVPLIGDAVLWAWARRPLFRLTLTTEGGARWACAHRRAARRLHRRQLAECHRRAKTKRSLTGQLDAEDNRVTLELLDGLRRFDHPTLLIWATEDPHFGPQWGERLLADILGATRLEHLPDSGHLLMEERPDTVVELIRELLLHGRLSGFDSLSDPAAMCTDDVKHAREPCRAPRPCTARRRGAFNGLGAAAGR